MCLRKCSIGMNEQMYRNNNVTQLRTSFTSKCLQFRIVLNSDCIIIWVFITGIIFVYFNNIATSEALTHLWSNIEGCPISSQILAVLIRNSKPTIISFRRTALTHELCLLKNTEYQKCGMKKNIRSSGNKCSLNTSEVFTATSFRNYGMRVTLVYEDNRRCLRSSKRFQILAILMRNSKPIITLKFKNCLHSQGLTSYTLFSYFTSIYHFKILVSFKYTLN